jgi:nitrate reductase gamma subunit
VALGDEGATATIPHDRHTVAIWFRGVFALQNHAQLMASAPLVYQIHTLSAWAILYQTAR